MTFAAGDVAPKTATIPIVNDALAEPDETFEVAMSNASGAALGTVTTATITIPANDQPVPPPANGLPGSLQLSASAYAVDESSGNLIVTVTRIGGTSGIVGATLTICGGHCAGRPGLPRHQFGRLVRIRRRVQPHRLDSDRQRQHGRIRRVLLRNAVGADGRCHARRTDRRGRIDP